jgi:predicted amidophosphoribosyltransferase
MPKGYPESRTCKGCGDIVFADFNYCPMCGEPIHHQIRVYTPRFVQALNPVTKHWIKIDRKIGSIVSRSRTSVPYKNIEVVGKH